MEFKINDLHGADFFLNSDDKSQKDYWAKRVNERLNQLNPLIHELALKDICLGDISQDLQNEYNGLFFIKIRYGI